MNYLNIILLAMLSILGCQKNMNIPSTSILSAPLRKAINLKKLDSKSIDDALQYQLLINLNLTLLEYDNETNLVTLLAEDYNIKENQIIFKIKKGIKTVSGHEITGADAEASLKRVIFSSGSHSRLSELLCENNKETCVSISSDGYELKLEAKKKSYIPFILSLLTNADNVIMPLTALSSAGPDSSIINFKETSGPYYIKNAINDEKISNFKLNVNNKHLMYNAKMADEVTYSIADYEKLIINENDLELKFNYIHNVTELKLSQIKKMLNTNSNVEVFPTAGIKNTMIFTTKEGRKSLNNDDIMYYSLLVRNTLLDSKNHPLNIVESQIEYFPAGGDGRLQEKELKAVKEKYNSIITSYKPINKKFKLGVYELFFNDYKILFENTSSIEVIKIIDSPQENNKLKVDAFIDTIDSSFTESLDLLEYNKTFEIFNVTDSDIEKYINADSKNERLNILRLIHFKSLMETRFVTIGTAPYYTIIGKKWTGQPSAYHVGYPVWKIKMKD